MIILEQPFVSSVLLDFLEKTNIPVLANSYSLKIKNRKLNLWSEKEFINHYHHTEQASLYTVSEYALDWVINNLKDEELNREITVMKDKTLFRKACAKVYPNFFFREISYNDLLDFDTSNLQFPLVLKPSIGFLSAGVYTIDNVNDWEKALADIKQNFLKEAALFPDNVVKSNRFIIESYISGEEFALDLYFKEDKPVIINIFKHPFVSNKDVKDRIYLTNKNLFDKYLDLFSEKICAINKELGLKNIPVHVELRVEDGEVIPIEFNPLRFAGLCLNELHTHIAGKHPLEYYFRRTKPDYEKMWQGKENETFSFSAFERPINAGDKTVDIDKLKRHFSSILEIRENKNTELNILAFVFSKTQTSNKSEIDEILNIDVEQLIK